MPIAPDWWGLNGPPTARIISIDRQTALRHSLAFQCVVNMGVRGSEAIRTRVVQAGALDLVSQILETWLKQRGVSIFAGSLGSQAAVDAMAAGLPIPGVEERRRGSKSSRSGASGQGQAQGSGHQPTGSAVTVRASSVAQFVSGLTGLRPAPREVERSEPRASDTDVDMADAEGGDEATDSASAGGPDDSMDVDQEPQAGPSTTPRAPQMVLPMPIPASRFERREAASQASSAGNSLSGDDTDLLPRATSENNLAAAGTNNAPRPPPLNLGAARIPALAQDTISNASSPMGTPTRPENTERGRGRRGTILGRPVNVNLAPRNERRRDREGGSGTSDGGEEVDLPAAVVAAGIAAANAQAMEGGGTVIPDEPGPPPDVEIVEGPAVGDPDADEIAAEQARLDMEAGAPPGQPGAAQTPRVPPGDAVAPLDPATATAQQQTQIIIANGAPRGFHDLGSYVGVSSLLNPDDDIYSDDSILLALQLLAYLSKYPHVRTAFHYPNRPMHPTFNLGVDNSVVPLPERPVVSESPNVFSLVERFTFKPSHSDPMLKQMPKEIQYWAGVIMRNACRKDEAQGGIRQCANMTCGKWEKFPREFAKCRRCRKAKYCSKECQSRAWSEGHRFWYVARAHWSSDTDGRCNTRTEDGPGGAAGEAGDAAGAGAAGGAGRPDRRGRGDEDEEMGEGEVPLEIITRIRAGARGDAVGDGGFEQAGPPAHNRIPAQHQLNLLQEVMGRGNPDRATNLIDLDADLPAPRIRADRAAGLFGTTRDITETRHRTTARNTGTGPARAATPAAAVPTIRPAWGNMPGNPFSLFPAPASTELPGRALTPIPAPSFASEAPSPTPHAGPSRLGTQAPFFTRTQTSGSAPEGTRDRQ